MLPQVSEKLQQQVQAELAREQARQQLTEQLRQLQKVVSETQQGALPPLPQEVRSGGPQLVYQAYVKMREELREQLGELQDQREETSEQLQSPMVSGSDRAGLSRRIESLDDRIATLDRQLADVDRAIASAAAAPGVRIASTQPPDERPNQGPPEEAVVLGGLFILAVLLPLTIAYARRIWRRGAQVVAEFPREIGDRLARMDQNIDAIALEVERIGEAQRYLTRMQAEQALPAGSANPVETPAREQDWQRRSP